MVSFKKNPQVAKSEPPLEDDLDLMDKAMSNSNIFPKLAKMIVDNWVKNGEIDKIRDVVTFGGAEAYFRSSTKFNKFEIEIAAEALVPIAQKKLKELE